MALQRTNEKLDQYSGWIRQLSAVAENMHCAQDDDTAHLIDHIDSITDDLEAQMTLLVQKTGPVVQIGRK